MICKRTRQEREQQELIGPKALKDGVEGRGRGRKRGIGTSAKLVKKGVWVCARQKGKGSPVVPRFHRNQKEAPGAEGGPIGATKSYKLLFQVTRR